MRVMSPGFDDDDTVTREPLAVSANAVING